MKGWLTDQRKRVGLSQEAAARKADISLGVVRTAEQTGSPPDLHHFLSLVMAYDAELELVNQIREWREATRQGEAGPSVTPDPAVAHPTPHVPKDFPDEERATIDAGLAAAAAKKSAKDARGKGRRASGR